MKESCREEGSGDSWALGYLGEILDTVLCTWGHLLRGVSWFKPGLQDGDGADQAGPAEW